MMGRRNRDQGQLFYSFDLDAAVPGDHLVRQIAAVLDLTWVYDELAPHYPSIGRPSIDPVLGRDQARIHGKASDFLQNVPAARGVLSGL